MNQRIKDLAEQAYEYSNIPNSEGIFNKEKFAKLIVRECCSQVREIDAMEIRKHFGVKE